MIFNKDKCNKCGKKVDKNSSFCSNCGMPINHSKRGVDNRKKDNYGLLGKNDLPEDSPFSEMGKMPPGFNFILDKLMKKFGKEFTELSEEMQKKLLEEKEGQNNLKNDSGNEKNNGNFVRKGLNINISSSNGQPPKIKVTSFGNPENTMVQELKSQKEKTKDIKNNYFSKKKSQEYSELPKKNPEKNVKRFSDKIEYEIFLPGVKSIENVELKKLEESVEIKAIGNKTAYFKTIPVNLKLKDYSLEKEKLILDFETE